VSPAVNSAAIVGAVVAAVVAVVGVGTACERPPVTVDPPAPDPSNPDVVDVTTFVQDRPAIGGKWYEYAVDGHVLAPRPHAWLLRTADGRSAAFRIVTVYDADTGESGRFTLEHSARTGDRWTVPSRFVVDGNVKDGVPLCVDLLGVDRGDRPTGGPAMRDCQQPGWQLRLVQQSRLSVGAGFAVAEPAVFVADGVVIARIDAAASIALDTLPDPTTIRDLDEAPPRDPTTTDWDFSRFARDLPQDGRVLGALSLVDGQHFDVVTSSFLFATVAVTRDTGNTGNTGNTGDNLIIKVTRRPVDRETGTLGAEATATVRLASSSLPQFVLLEASDLRTPADRLADTRWPTKPPFARDYDLVVVPDDRTGEPAILLSPAVAARRRIPASTTE
jgi:hypothetical protein